MRFVYLSQYYLYLNLVLYILIIFFVPLLHFSKLACKDPSLEEYDIHSKLPNLPLLRLDSEDYKSFWTSLTSDRNGFSTYT